MENYTFYLDQMRMKQQKLFRLKSMFKRCFGMLTLLLLTTFVSAQSGKITSSELLAEPEPETVEAELAGCSLSLNHNNVECLTDLTGFLEIDITTALAGDYTFTWTYSADAFSPDLPLPAGITNGTMTLPLISSPMSIETYMDIPAG